MCYVQLWVHICIASKAVYIYVNLFELLFQGHWKNAYRLLCEYEKKPVMENLLNAIQKSFEW